MPGPGHGSKLSRKQEQAIEGLLSEPTVQRAAQRAGVGYRTLKTWLSSDPAFVAAYRAARRQVVEGAITQLQQATRAAVRTLRRNLRCGNPGVEVKASQVILDQAVKAVELLDLEERLAALERAAKERQGR